MLAGGFGRLGPSANHLLYTITSIDLMLSDCSVALEGGAIVAKGLRKLLGYGFFVLLMTQ